MLKILFISDDLASFKVATDTTIALMVAAHELKATVMYCQPQELYVENNMVFANVAQLTILANNHHEITPNWYKVVTLMPKVNLNTFRAVMVRSDPPFNMEYYYLTQMLSLAEKAGAKVINNSFALRNFNEKLAILNFPQFIPATLVTKNKEIIWEFLQTHGECVIKPIDLMAGRGVFKISVKDVNCDAILEGSTNYFTQTVMVQKFIPEVIYGDKRVFIVDGEVIPQCLCRIPQGTAIRSNIAAGGVGDVQPLKTEDYTIANSVAAWLKAQNIIFAGLDIIGNTLTELNITSPTGVRQIFRDEGIDIAKCLLSKVLS